MSSFLYYVDGKDYIGLSLNVTSTGEVQCFNVTIIDDTIFESQSGEVFTVRLEILFPFVNLGSTANVIIQDNDGKL